MVEWIVAYSDYENKPEVVDTKSSPTTVYLRKDIEEYTTTDPETKEERRGWKYLEKTMTQQEYALAVNTAEMTQLRHDSDVIDEYTMSLIEEGII